MRYQRAELPLKLDGLKAAQSFFWDCIADSDPARESVWVAHVDEKANCLHFSRHDGEEAEASFPIGSIIADAARHGSAGIILAHNHPSGDPTPRLRLPCDPKARNGGGGARLHCRRPSGLRRRQVHQLAEPRAAVARADGFCFEWEADAPRGPMPGQAAQRLASKTSAALRPCLVHPGADRPPRR